MEDELKNSYELKKEAKEAKRAEEHGKIQTEKTKKIIKRFIIFVAVIVLIVYGLFLLVRSVTPQGEDFSISYSNQGGTHIDEGAEHPAYNSNPPSSGWHYSAPARGGFYPNGLPDERVIHNLEHGDIWIAYSSSITDEAVLRALESFAGNYVVVSPRDENESDISLVAWRRVDSFNLKNGILDEERIKDFIKRYDNRGPEKVRNIQINHGAL